VKGPRWLSSVEVLAIHERVLAEHGGLAGLRDPALFESVPEGPRHLFVYGKPTVFDLAAACAHGIARNHPFLDGNERTALVASGVFLELHGHRLLASEPKAVIATLELAAGNLSQRGFAMWLEKEPERVVRTQRRTRR
jgi:death on curing protein